MIIRRTWLEFAVLAFAGLGSVALASTLLPSPARLVLYTPLQVSPPEPHLPASMKPITSGDISVILEHPIFNTDRARDPEPKTDQVLPGLETYRLTGTITSDNASIAFVEKIATKSTVTLRVGDSLDGRLVKIIGPEGITFSGATSDETLTRPKPAGIAITTDQTATQR